MKQMLQVTTTGGFTEPLEDLKGPERSEKPQPALGIDRLPPFSGFSPLSNNTERLGRQ